MSESHGPTITAHFFVCTNLRGEDSPLPCCARRGSVGVYDAFRAELARRGYPVGAKVTAASCLTPCLHGPNVAVYPENTWYAGVTEADVAEIVRAHLDEGRAVDRLRLPEGVRV